MIYPINPTEIRGRWTEIKEINGKHVPIGGGDDTLESIKNVADKLNEVIAWINSKNDQLL